MAWITFEDLLAKAGVTGASSEQYAFGTQGSSAPVFNASNLKSLSKNEAGALSELYNSAREVMKQAGVPPDSVRQVSNVTDSGDFSYEIPNWNLDTIRETLAGRGVKLAYDPSRDKGNWGSSKSHSIQLGLLDAAGNPVQEYRVGEGSLASGVFKGFVVPFAQIALTANASAIGAAIAPTASSTVQSAIGSAVASGAGTALAGGDAEDVIKNALTGGAVGAASSLVKPYIQDAIDFVKDLAPSDLEQIAGSVDATAATGGVANNLAGVEVGGADAAGDVGVDLGGAEVGYVNPLAGGVGFDYAGGTENIALAQMTPQAQTVYLDSLAQGLPPSVALTRAIATNSATVGQELTPAAVNTPTNALLGGGATVGAADTAATTTPAGYVDPLAGGAGFDYAGVAEQSTSRYLPTPQGDTMSTPTAVTPTGQVATVDLTGGQNVYDPYTGLAENFPLYGFDGNIGGPVNTTIAGTADFVGPVDTRTAAAGGGLVGAGALGAGAVGTVGGGLTVPAGAGLGDVGKITTPGGLDATVAGGTGITAGTTGGAGLDTSGLALGGALGAGAAAGSALPVGSAAAAGSAITPAAGLTGIQAVDDFLSYLGTPAGAMALSAFGGLAGGYFQGQAAKEAAQTQATAAQNALALQREMFEYQKSLLEPYQEAGTAALGRLTGVMGLGSQPATGGQQLLEMDPGYAFRLGEGMKALERLQAARGNMLSGGAIKAGQRYAQDVASQEYGNAYNRLANIAGLGQTTGTQLGAAGQQFGSAAGETMAQQANALAAGRVGRTSAYTQGINTAANAFGNFANQQQQNQLFRDIYGRAFGG
jgi:hypothetical protein